MAFKYGTTSPTAIKYNGTDLTVLKYGSTAVWGKPYSLSISAGANTTVTVNRTSSPNQHASTGNLSSGSVIYYGDVLKITATASSGYNLSTFTVNGSGFTSGNTVTVTGAVTVITTAGASASWKTVFTGNAIYGETQGGTGTLTVNGVKANLPTRVTGRLAYNDGGMMGDEGSSSFTAVELNATVSCGGGKVLIGTPMTANKLSLNFTANYYEHPFAGSAPYNLILYITKVEQYY